MPQEEKAKILPVERPSEVEKVPEAPIKAPAIEILPRPSAEKEIPVKAPLPITPVPVAPPPPQDPLLKQIEAVLVEDLETVYAELPPEVKPKFKVKGEEVAQTIREMLETAKVKARKVLKLIYEWLKIIPGVNKFFLEQEAAIKAQKIMTIAEEEKKKA